MTAPRPALFDSVPSLQPHLVGRAALEPRERGVCFLLQAASGEHYHDSQVDDFHGRPREAFLWQPPLMLELQARFSHSQAMLQGTAGFGWWNAPFAGDRATTVAVGPQALWFFFGSPPNQLATTPGWSGSGWFAQGLHTPAVPGWLVEVGMRLLRVPPFGWLARQLGGRAARAAEQPLPDLDLTAWHHYRIEWRPERADFLVDDTLVLRVAAPPPGPLALVLWMDNQWATLDGMGGVLALPAAQWMEIEALSVTTL